jgi:DNA-binding transcriptional ArsR family regulator
MAKLRFLTNNALVLIHVANNPKSTLREIAAAVGVTERAVQTVLGDMERERLVKKRRRGRKNEYWVFYANLVEYPLEGPYRTVVDLAQALTDLGRRLREGDIPMDFPEDD